MGGEMGSNSEAPVVVTTTGKSSEASVIKSLLESYGIPCHYSSEHPQQLYPVSGEGLSEIRIFVPAALALEAQRVLKEHRRQGHLHLVEI
jgi:hypothetical protein